ncbi:hypothetical protein Bbelb_182060 [Branchiostoma belcheri]|nr:hypothetical protein Bbelb_182060 [Branchiostoma belcheri]
MYPVTKLFFLCVTASVAFSKNSVEVNDVVVQTEGGSQQVSDGNAIVEEITTENITTSTTVTSGDDHYVECPPMFDGYCLHGGTCLYLPDHPDPNQRPLCRCTPEYTGSRCQVGNINTRRGMSAGSSSTSNHAVMITAVSGVLSVVSVVLLLGAVFLGWRVYRRRKAGYDVQADSGVSQADDKTGYGSTAALN